MIKLVLSDHPDNYDHEARLRLREVLDIDAGLGRFDTEITHNGSVASSLSDDSCWDIDVYFSIEGWKQRVPSLSREGVSTRDMLFEMMLAANGDADAWVRTLLSDADAEGLWDRYRREAPDTV